MDSKGHSDEVSKGNEEHGFENENNAILVGCK
jgi:hypothetical protein